MIGINGVPVIVERFPDGTPKININTDFIEAIPFDNSDWIYIDWQYESDAELFVLYLIKKHLETNFVDVYYGLNLPYIPNARMDRVKNDDEVFTLKYFCDFINSLNFDVVWVLDPHSYVSEALINNVEVENPKNYLETILGRIESQYNYEEITAFYPDEGAMKRYSGMLDRPYAFGIKRRDWKSGRIEGLDVSGCVEDIKDKVILIVDDICSRGGTFYHSAKKLKELGAKEIYLFVTHCENTIFEGELLTSDLIKKIYTTNSIFKEKHEKIEVMEI